MDFNNSSEPKRKEVRFRYSIIKSFTEKLSNRLTVTELCKLVKVSRSGYYNWLTTADQRKLREHKDKMDFALVLEAYKFRGFDKGSRGIHMRLLHQGIRMNRKKIQRLMKKFGLVCPIRKANPHRRLAKALRTNAVADNHLKREFKQRGLRKTLLTDITYIPYSGRFCYLSVIMDSYTSQVLAYVISESLELDFVLQTVTQLMKNHTLNQEDEVLIHSDQGSHYTSIKFRELINDHGLRQSMSRRGNCWDNAPQESFFGHMKCELAEKITSWKTFEQVKTDVDDWIDYYNNDRYQWGLEKLSPNQYYTYITTGNNPLALVA